LHQVGDLFELNVKLRCQKVNNFQNNSFKRKKKMQGRKLDVHKRYFDLVFFLPGTGASSLGDWYPTFRGYIMVSSSRFEMPNNNVGHHHPIQPLHTLEGRRPQPYLYETGYFD